MGSNCTHVASKSVIEPALLLPKNRDEHLNKNTKTNKEILHNLEKSQRRIPENNHRIAFKKITLDISSNENEKNTYTKRKTFMDPNTRRIVPSLSPLIKNNLYKKRMASMREYEDSSFKDFSLPFK
jgi:hypothetical protein